MDDATYEYELGGGYPVDMVAASAADDLPVEFVAGGATVNVSTADVLRDISAGISPEVTTRATADVLREYAAGRPSPEADVTSSPDLAGLTDLVRSFVGVADAGVEAANRVIALVTGDVHDPRRPVSGNRGTVNSLGQPITTVAGFSITPMLLILAGGAWWLLSRR